VGSPPNGQVSGANNDYLFVCAPVGNVYYSKASGDLHNLLTWGVNLDGSGANPSDFGAGKIFQLANRGAVYTMTGNWSVNGTINIPASSELRLNGNTLSLTDVAGVGTLAGSPTSNMVVIGTNGGNVPINFSAASNMLNNFTINRSGTGASATLGSALHILNVLTVSDGTLNTSNFLTLRSSASNTARVAPILGSGNVLGNVTVERYIPSRSAWRILSAPVGGITDAAIGSAALTHDEEPGAGPVTTSGGTPRPLSYGTATFSLNAARTTMTFTATIFNIDINGLQTPDPNDNLVAAHIHVGAPSGANAPVRWGFFGSPDNDNNPDNLVVTPFATGVGGTFSSTWDLPEGNGGTTLTTNLPGILAGLAYINFHTTQFGGGEVRGQIRMAGPGTQTINQAWQEGAVLGLSPNPNPAPGYGTHITGGAVYGSTANGFDQNPISGAMSSLKTYNSLQNNWVDHPNTNATPVSAEAFMVFVGGDRGIPLSYDDIPSTPTTLRASGPLKVGDQTFQVSPSSFTGIPNPFASPIDFATITRSGVQNNFYVWDPKMGGTYGVGAYVLISFNGATYDVIPASVSPESQYIQSGQGFLVQPSTPGVAGTLTIKESDKSATPAMDVFRTTVVSNNKDAKNPLIADPTAGQGLRVSLLVKNKDNTTAIADEVFTSYRSNFSDKLDALDADKIANRQENLGIITKGRILMVERRAVPKEGDVIALKLWNATQKTYLLDISPIGLSGLGLSAVLEDKYLKTSMPLSLTSKVQIEFSINTVAASARADRFQIKIIKGGVEDLFTKNTISVYPNPVIDRNISLWFDNKPAGKYEVAVVNGLGQVVFRKSLQHPGGSSMQVLQVDTKLVKGTYQIKVDSKEESSSISIISNQ
ncbi:MAG: CHRD domain-containing protein, partial [Moraxellaceae bacterium]